MRGAAFFTGPARARVDHREAMHTPHVHQLHALSPYGTLEDPPPPSPAAPTAADRADEPADHGPVPPARIEAARRAAAQLPPHHG